MPQKIDLTGMRFGKLTVLYESGKKTKRGEVYWMCRCDCGKEKEILGNNLRRGLSKSCGCIQRNDDDLTGQRFGMLIALYKSEKTRGGAYCWHCRCDCGNEVDIPTSKLENGHTKSCGCLKENDLTGRRFGRLTVLRRSGRKNESGHTYWVCRCDCGVEKEILHNALTSGTALSCGCLHKDAVNARMERIASMGTNPDRLRYCDKPQANNTTGKTGVIYNKNTGLYEARITFKGVRYSLKTSRDINECIAARKQAEEEIFGDFLKWYDEQKIENQSEERKAFLNEKNQKKEEV